MIDKFPFPFGCELTAIPDVFEEDYQDLWEYPLVTQAAIRFRKRMQRRGIPAWRVAADNHCVEVASPVFERMSEARLYSQIIRKLFRQSHCYPKHPDSVCGGCHVHVGIEWPPLIIALQRDLTMRPYLPWVFSEPDECGACDAMITKGDNRVHWPNWHMAFGGSPRSIKNPELQYRIRAGTKSDMFAYTSYKTLEFRFFEMTETWDEQELQLKFLQRYIAWVRARWQSGDVTRVRFETFEELQRRTAKSSITQFRDLLDNLELHYSDYRPFVTRNLLPRWQNGRCRY